MKSEAVESSASSSSSTKSSPPCKKSRSADFQMIVKRSHSVTEESIDMDKSYNEKIINDRYL